MNNCRFNHFISIPINSEEVKANFLQFKQDISKNYDDFKGFSKEMIQKPEKLHLTICMLHLFQKSELHRAIEAFHRCKTDIIEPILKERKSLVLDLHGLKCMQFNSKKAKVLYIGVREETGLLQKMADAISAYFVAKGLSTQDHERVTLHMTVVNKKFQKIENLNGYYRYSFDAGFMLKDYENINLGKIKLTTMHLSAMMKKSPDGYYAAAAKINI